MLNDSIYIALKVPPRYDKLLLGTVSPTHWMPTIRKSQSTRLFISERQSGESELGVTHVYSILRAMWDERDE